MTNASLRYKFLSAKELRNAATNKFISILVAVTVLVFGAQVHAGQFAPAPQIIAQYDRSFIERSGAQTFGEMLDTGIIRYFFTGGRNLLVMVNGRPYTTTGGNLDTLPLSAIERIEVLRAESLGTIAGQAAVRGAFNLVLRDDLDGFDFRSVVRKPTRDGGEALQGSAVWGGAIGTEGHMTFGIDIFDRSEIAGKDREHSRSQWTKGGSFSDAKNVSIGGNTLFAFDTGGEQRTAALGECEEEHGYTGKLKNPGWGRPDDEGCGYAYGDVWWDTPSYQQKNAILNLSHPLGEQSEFRMDANFTDGREKFRYAPSVGSFYFRIPSALNDEGELGGIKLDNNQFVVVAHRFIGHGNREWLTDTEEYDFSANISGQLAENLGYDAGISAYSYDYSLIGNTFVHTPTIREKIQDNEYNLADPLDKTTKHTNAIRDSSVQEEDNATVKYRDLRFALEGTTPGIGERNLAWTAGVEFSDVDVRKKLEFVGNDGEVYDVDDVLGSSGTSYAGKRDAKGAFAEVSFPLSDSLDIRAAARTDDYSDVGKLRARRLGAEFRLSETTTLRGSLSTGDGSPSMYALHSTAAQDHPFVDCLPTDEERAQGACNPSANAAQVRRYTTGNPDLNPSKSKRTSFGFGNRNGPFYFVADWYRLITYDLPASNDSTWAILNLKKCGGENLSEEERANLPEEELKNCVHVVSGRHIIYDSFANVIKTEVTGLNTRFGNRFETDWGFVAFRGFWRYVSKSTEEDMNQKRDYPLPRHAVRIVTSAGRGNVTGYWGLNYRSEIKNQSGSGEFPSWLGHDLTLDWKNPGGYENTRITFGVYNVTDTKLSTNTTIPGSHDGPVAAGWGRTFFATLNVRF